MKQKDVALIVVVAVVRLVLATVLSNMVFSGRNARNLTAEKVQPITGDFETLDPKYFNADSVDPTETIRIETNANQAPFNQE